MFNENNIKNAMQAAIDHVKTELKNLRTGRANPAVLDGVRVEVYGTLMKIRDIASVSVPESRQILITPYDAQNIHAIKKAIETANLNLQPMVDSNVVRINIPPMDETIRKDMVKLCKKKAEDGKIVIRDIRRKFNEEVRKDKTSGDITEDMQKANEKKIQELTDKYCKNLDTLCAEKEKEILEI
jgi:ribosome recycling factor